MNETEFLKRLEGITLDMSFITYIITVKKIDVNKCYSYDFWVDTINEWNQCKLIT